MALTELIAANTAAVTSDAITLSGPCQIRGIKDKAQGKNAFSGPCFGPIPMPRPVSTL